MFWGPDIGSELLLLVGVVGTVALLIIAVTAPETFIVVLLATKPFIDLTWNHPFFSFGGFSARSSRGWLLRTLSCRIFVFFSE